MLKVEFNTTAVRKAISAAKNSLEDMSPIFRDVREYMVRATRRRFIEAKAPDGKAWAPKSEATLDRYKRLGYGGLTLTRALTGHGRRLSREVRGHSDRNGAVIGSMLIYSRVMQEGAGQGAFGTNGKGRPIPWGRIPARRWLGISPADEAALVAIAEEHVQSALDGKA